LERVAVVSGTTAKAIGKGEKKHEQKFGFVKG
jgi:hypothetical protein